MRSKGSVEGALPAKVKSNQRGKGKSNKKEYSSSDTSSTSRETNFDSTPCRHCGKNGYPPFKCSRRPNQYCKLCQQMGHHQKKCKSNT